MQILYNDFIWVSMQKRAKSDAKSMQSQKNDVQTGRIRRTRGRIQQESHIYKYILQT